MKKVFRISIIILLIIFTICLKFCIKTSNHSTNNKIGNIQVKNKIHDDSVEYFINRLNYPEMKMPFTGNFSSSEKVDTMDYKLIDSKEYLYNCKLFAKGEYDNALNITVVSEIHFYDEGDLDGDGTHEIGILPGYNTSACRNYLVYSYKNHHWKLLYSINSHLGDRRNGVDYVKKEGNKIRILSADDGCCGCSGLDTFYQTIKNANNAK